MIDRYTRPEMGHIFSLENKYAIWQDVDEVDAIEAVTNHDVIAFLTDLGEHIDAEVPEGEPGTPFREKLAADPRVSLSGEALDAIFDPRSFLTRVDAVFDRLGELSFE